MADPTNNGTVYVSGWGDTDQTPPASTTVAAPTTGTVYTPDLGPVPQSDFEARVNNYRDAASKRANEESSALSFNPLNFSHVPLIGPAYARAVDYVGALAGDGEGDTVDDRYLNNQAYRAALEDARYRKNPIAYNLAIGTTGAITPLPELGLESQIAGAVEKAPSIVKSIAPYVGKMGEAGVYGGSQAVEEARPGEAPSEVAKEAGSAALSSGIIGPALGKAVAAGTELGANVGTSVADLFRPETAAARQIAEAAATAPSARPSQRGLTIDQYTDMVQRGEPVTVADIHGVKPLLSMAAGQMPEDTRLEDLNDALTQRLNESGKRISDSVDQAFGGPIDNYAARQAAQDAARKANKPAYDLAYSSPDAQAILTPALQTAAKTAEGKEALAWAINQSNKESAIYGTPPVRNPLVQNDRGEMVIPPFYRPDLQFWDLFKRGLNTVTQKQYAASDKSAPQTAQMTQKITQDLRNLVPEYGKALDQSGNFIRADNAYDAGSNFADLVRSKNADPDEISQHLDNFNNKFSPDERTTFRLGLAGAIKENPTAWSKVFAQNDPKTMDRLQQVLGEDQFNGIDAAMRMNRMLAMTREIGAKGQIGATAADFAHGAGQGLLAAAPFAIEHAPDLLQHVQDPMTLAGLGTVAAVGGLAKAGSDYVSNARADALLHMATSDDPKIRQQLINASISNEAFRKALSDTEDRLGRFVATRYTPGYVQRDRQERKAGGRVSDVESAASRLVRESERTKNLISNHTERMLTLPDDDIVNALSIAKRAI